MTAQKQDEILLAQMQAKQKPISRTLKPAPLSNSEKYWDKWRHNVEFPEREAVSEAEEARRAKDEQTRIENGMQQAGIERGSRFWNARLDGYRTPTPGHLKALTVCREAVKGFSRGEGLLLFGDPGGGKTHLLVGMLHEAISAGLTARLITAEGFFLGLRSCVGEKRSEERYIDELSRVGVLALDDIYCLAAAKSGNEESYQYRMLWYLLDRRYFLCKSTIASTNRSLEEFKDMIDERTRRRLQATQVMVPKLPKESERT